MSASLDGTCGDRDNPFWMDVLAVQEGVGLAVGVFACVTTRAEGR